jgi:hypothetical protein
VVHLLEQAVAEHPRLSLLELEGLARISHHIEMNRAVTVENAI